VPVTRAMDARDYIPHTTLRPITRIFERFVSIFGDCVRITGDSEVIPLAWQAALPDIEN